MSLRQQAKILGVSAPYLSQMINGRRPWNEAVRMRYYELVANVSANTQRHMYGERPGIVPRKPQNGHDIAEVIGSNPLPPTITLCVGVAPFTFFAPVS